MVRHMLESPTASASGSRGDSGTPTAAPPSTPAPAPEADGGNSEADVLTAARDDDGAEQPKPPPESIHCSTSSSK